MDSTESEIKSAVRSFIVAEFLAGEKEEALDDASELITSGILDSIATVRLVAFLEERYGIEFEAHEISVDLLNRLPDITRLVTEKQSERSRA